MAPTPACSTVLVVNPSRPAQSENSASPAVPSVLLAQLTSGMLNRAWIRPIVWPGLAVMAYPLQFPDLTVLAFSVRGLASAVRKWIAGSARIGPVSRAVPAGGGPLPLAAVAADRVAAMAAANAEAAMMTEILILFMSRTPPGAGRS